MNRHRHNIITETLAHLAHLPTQRLICPAARAAHRQQGPCPPLWRPLRLYQYYRRQQALTWLLDAVARSLQEYCTVSGYLSHLLPAQSADEYRATLSHVRTKYLQDLLNHTTEDSPTLKFEDHLPTIPTTSERNPK